MTPPDQALPKTKHSPPSTLSSAVNQLRQPRRFWDLCCMNLCQLLQNVQEQKGTSLLRIKLFGLLAKWVLKALLGFLIAYTCVKIWLHVCEHMKILWACDPP